MSGETESARHQQFRRRNRLHPGAEIPERDQQRRQGVRLERHRNQMVGSREGPPAGRKTARQPPARCTRRRASTPPQRPARAPGKPRRRRGGRPGRNKKRNAIFFGGRSAPPAREDSGFWGRRWAGPSRGAAGVPECIIASRLTMSGGLPPMIQRTQGIRWLRSTRFVAAPFLILLALGCGGTGEAPEAPADTGERRPALLRIPGKRRPRVSGGRTRQRARHPRPRSRGHRGAGSPDDGQHGRHPRGGRTRFLPGGGGQRLFVGHPALPGDERGVSRVLSRGPSDPRHGRGRHRDPGRARRNLDGRGAAGGGAPGSSTPRR